MKEKGKMPRGHYQHTRYFEEPLAPWFEALRKMARKRNRIVYDCFNTIVKDNQVICKLGRLSNNRHSRLLQVLKGRAARVCQNCEDYSD